MTNELLTELENVMFDDIVEAVAEIERLEQRNLEVSILASKWMEAHDNLKAGKPYKFPTVADKSDLEAEIERLRDALERVTTDCQLAINVLGNSPAEFDSVRKSFEIVRDRAIAAIKGQP
jgi:hypothetical protein